MKACSRVIIERFEEICHRDEQQYMLELGLENLLSILKSDKLNLMSEDYMIELIRAYIQVRDEVPTKAPESAE